jgi:hypothetical protein
MYKKLLDRYGDVDAVKARKGEITDRTKKEIK